MAALIPRAAWVWMVVGRGDEVPVAVGRLGFLHTASAHVDVFDALLNEFSPSLAREHVVRPDLLARAQLAGDADRHVRVGVAAAIAEYRRPVAVLCTCSTIGGVAEDCGRERGIPLLRVDRPMAELAVRSGKKIAIVAALASTLTPTRALLESVARDTRLSVEIVDVPCLDAWESFEQGHRREFHRRIAQHVEALDPSFDAAVLAQASMAPAARLISSGIRVFTSPRMGVEAAYRMAVMRTDVPQDARSQGQSWG